MKLRVVLLIGDNLRHKYLLSQCMAAGVNLVGVVVQERLPDPVMRKPSIADDDREILEFHFGLRDRVEKEYFGGSGDAVERCGSIPVMRIPEGRINDDGVVDFVKKCTPDAIAVWGTRLLKEPLISVAPDRIVNLHLGLSPYYRGAATIFWPLYNDEPEYCGATIHRINMGIDKGEIFHHVRPEISADDNPHTVGCKTVVAGAEGILRTLWEFERGDASPVRQWDKGSLYQQKDFRPEHARELYQMIEDGLFSRYKEREPKVRYAMRLVG